MARNATLPAGPRRQDIKRSVLLRAAAVAAASAGAGVASATSLAGKLVLTGIVATLATGGAIGVWKWRTADQAGAGQPHERAPAGRHERTQPGRREALSRPASPQAEAPPLGLGAPPAPVPQAATRALDRSLAPIPSLPTQDRRTHAEAVVELPRTPEAIPRLKPALVPPTLVQETGRGQLGEPWPVYRAPPVPQAVLGASTSARPLPTAPQEPWQPEVSVPGGGHPSFQDRQPMPASPSPAGGVLEQEVAELRRAQEALRSGQPALALRLLAEYDRSYPAGSLHEERAAIAAIATCQIDPGAQAQARAQAFLREAPRSLLANRVRAACLAQDRDAK
jgi:hypothetical protein